MKKWEEEKRDMTLEEASYEFQKAWREFCFEFLKSLGIIRLFDWLVKRLNK